MTQLLCPTQYQDLERQRQNYFDRKLGLKIVKIVIFSSHALL